MATSTVALIIIGVMMVLYATEILPLATTSLLGCLALAVFGVIPLADAFRGFGNDMVYLIVGMVVVGDALFETGAAGLIGKKIISVVGTNEKAFIGAIIIVILPISAFLSNTATVAMMLPIAASAIAASKGTLKKKDTYMILGLVAVAGGGLTLVSSTPQLIAQALLLDGGYEPIGFFELSYIGIPVLVLLVVYVFTVGHKLKKRIFNFPEAEDEKSEDETSWNKTSEDETASNGAGLGMSHALSNGANNNASNDANNDASNGAVENTRKDTIKMCIAAAILVFCIVGFVSGLWSMGIVAMIGAVLCIVTGCISQERVFSKMNWTSVILIGCSFGLARGLEFSGAGSMVAQGLVGLMGEHISPWLLCASLALVTVIITNFMSSTATAALLVPIAALAAIELDYSVKAAVMAVAIAANIGYATPIATPPLTMTLTGGYRFMDYVKYGGILNILAYILIIALFPLVFHF